jgi:hypothetical protein
MPPEQQRQLQGLKMCLKRVFLYFYILIYHRNYLQGDYDARNRARPTCTRRLGPSRWVLNHLFIIFIDLLNYKGYMMCTYGEQQIGDAVTDDNVKFG